MTVKDLKKLLENADDEMQVLIPVDSTEFTGAFYTPCNEESGVADLGIVEGVDVTAQDFILVPCGFFDSAEKEEEE